MNMHKESNNFYLNRVFAILLAFVSTGAYAKDTLLGRYYTPASAGIIWITMNPSPSDDSYLAHFTVTCNGKEEEFGYSRSRL